MYKDIYRCGNIGVRGYANDFNTEPKYEIIMWYPNTNYGKFDDFVWDKESGMFENKECPNYWTDPRFLIEKENNITLASVKIDEEKCCKYESYGSNIFKLSEKDRNDLLDVIEYIENELVNKNKEDDD